MIILPSALVHATSLSKRGFGLSKDVGRNRLCAAVFILSATTLLPKAAAQSLRHGRDAGSDASGIGAKFIAASDAVAVHSSGPDLSEVLVGASTPDSPPQESGVVYCSRGFDDCPDSMVCGGVDVDELLCESESDCPRSAFCDHNFGQCIAPARPCQFFWCEDSPNGSALIPPEPRFVEQGRGNCADSNGENFSRITYDAGDLDECKAKCSATGFESNLVGLDYKASRNCCGCRFDNGLQFTSQWPGRGNCPSDAHAYWSVGSSCANARNPTVGGVTGTDTNASGTVCLKNVLSYPTPHFDECLPNPSFGED